MSCRGSAWCPKCKQIISSSCICAGVCDIHGQVCTFHPPDGIHDRRREGSKDVTPKCVEYRNGWEVGYIGGMSDGTKMVWKWYTREPGHPTKSPHQVAMDEMAEQGQKARAAYNAIYETRADGGGI